MATRIHTFARLTRAIKPKIEEWSGLAFSDVLNVALFTLTVFTLVVAFIGVAVAWITYKDAQSSGVKQEAALNSAAQSLATARTTLEASQQRLTEMNGALGESIKVAREEQKELAASVELSKAQLSTLEKQVKMASRVPNVMLYVRCSGLSSVENELLHEETLRIGSGDHIFPGAVHVVDADTLAVKRSDSGNHKIQTDQNGIFRCELTLKNSGEGRLSNAYLRLHLRGRWSRHSGPTSGLPLRYSVSNSLWAAKDPNRGTGWLIAQGDYTGLDQPIDIVKDENIPPNNWLSLLSENDTKNLSVQVPPWVDLLFLDFQYGGDEQRADGGQLIISVNHIGQGTTKNPK